MPLPLRSSGHPPLPPRHSSWPWQHRGVPSRMLRPARPLTCPGVHLLPAAGTCKAVYFWRSIGVAVPLSSRSAGNEDTKAAGSSEGLCPPHGGRYSWGCHVREAGSDVRASRSGHGHGLRGQHRERDTVRLSFTVASFPQPGPLIPRAPGASSPSFSRVFRGHLPVMAAL